MVSAGCDYFIDGQSGPGHPTSAHEVVLVHLRRLFRL